MSTRRLVLDRRFLASLAAFVFLTLLAGSDVGSIQKAGSARMGQVVDWSTKHILYPQGASLRTLVLGGHDPRAYWNYIRLQQATSAAISPGGLRHRAPLGVRPRPRVDWSVPLGGGGTAPNMSPAKYSFDVNATPSCANDYAVFTIMALPGAAQANLAAFNNLYSGSTSTSCGTNTAPTALWAYEVGAHSLRNSPTLSLDGTKVAVVDGTAPPNFDVLTWTAGQGTVSAPATPAPAVTIAASPLGATETGTTVTITTTAAHGLAVNENVTVSGVALAGFNGTWLVTAIPTATTFQFTNTASGLAVSGGGMAGQLTSVVLTGGGTDTNSFPFVDYYDDIAYVASDGILFKITPLFNGTPALAGAPWPITVNAGGNANLLTTPVVDFNTGNIFMGSANGKLYGYTSAGVALLGSPLTIGNGTAEGGIADPPIVDVVNGRIYVATGTNGTNAVVAQTSTVNSATTPGFVPSLATVNLGATPSQVPIHAGAFNNAYLTSGTPFLYFCGAPTATSTLLYQIPFSAGVITGTGLTSVSLNAASGQACSPLTEFYNTEDRLFLGLLTTATVEFYNISNNPPTLDVAAVSEAGGTSGIIVDNVSAEAQASSIYFTTLATGTCSTSTITPSPAGARELTGTTVTIATTAAHGFGVGESVTIAGVGVGGYNGVRVVTAVPTSTTFQYTNPTSPLANSGGGTATASGFCAVKLTQGALQ